MPDETGFDWSKGEGDDSFSRFDDFQLGGGVADGKTLKVLDDEASGSVPAGVHTFVIVGAKITSLDPETKQPVESPRDVYKDGEAKTYFAYKLEVTLGLKSDPSATIRDFFVLPPGLGNDPDRQKEVDLYMTATTENVKPTKANTGFHFRKLKHFLGHAGVPIGDDGRTANISLGELRFWAPGVPREIVADVETPKEPKEGAKGGKIYNQLRLFSYKTAESTLARQSASGGTGGSPNGSVPPKPAKVSAEEVLADVDI